jgi:hypothetical protein
MRRSSWVVATTSTVATLALAAPAGSANAAPRGDGPRIADQLGVQLVPKHRAGKEASAFSNDKGANPLIALLPDPAKADYAYWNSAMKRQSAKRAAKRAAATRALAVEPLLVDEEEPDGIRGGNDVPANAQLIPAFGSAADRRPAARVLGTLAGSAAVEPVDAAPEDNGSIPLAGESGLAGSGTSTSTEATIGDGPHGTTGDRSGDFDFYAVRDAGAGQRLVVDIDTPTGQLDSLVVVYDSSGAVVASDDDSDGLDSLVNAVLPADGDYFVSVTGYPTVQEDPQDSGSGTGSRSVGPYAVTFGLDATDVDVYAVDLRAGDVLGGSVSGAANLLSGLNPAGRQVFGSSQDASALYPISSPLPGGGNAVVDHVAARSGLHYVIVQGDPGNYDLTLEVYRPGPQANAATQTVFLDFDGQRVNTGIWGGPGVRQLSPLSAFLGRWGIPASRQNAVVNRVVATVTENLRRDLAAQGVRVRVLNSRDHADAFGEPDVSRLIVGGTIVESGLPTIGIAQSIDPGNFDTEETALILLDTISGPADDDNSFNHYLGPTSNRVRFVGTALGNIASHEAGHILGSWHVDELNDVLNLMDRGGNYPLLYGVGPDGVGGTADDPDVDFGEDVFAPIEGFTGIENTAARTLWGLHP